MNTQNNRRLAKNTMMLYIRMLLIMAVSLYTIRVVLHILGARDFGIFNVVGGIVTAFSFITSTMASASERFLAFELGRNNLTRLKQIFSSSLTIYIIISIVILIISETFGLWFLNHKLNIPISRLAATNWIYQFSVLSFVVTLLTIPYNSAIIAHEQMNVYAYVSIAEALLKLGIVQILAFVSFDKLKLYGLLIFIVTLVITFIYRIYCTRKFEECRFKFYWNKMLFSDLLSYSGWNLFGALTTVSFNQGINFLLNIFFGPVINAASAIAMQVNNAISSFASNFYIAVKPQIVKAYANGNEIYTMELVFKSTKLGFFLMLIFSMPILLETDFVLKLWLNDVPEYAGVFVKLLLIFSYFNIIQIPLSTAVQATGNIKKYQVFVGAVMLMCLPISFVCLKFGLGPQYAYWSLIFVSLIAVTIRLRLLHQLIYFSYRDYIRQVLLKMLIVIILASVIPIIVVIEMKAGWIRFIVVSVGAIGSSLLFVYLIGLAKDEQNYMLGLIKK